MDFVWGLLEKIQTLPSYKGTSELALSCKSFDHGLLAFVAELRGVKEISVVEAVEIKANSTLVQSRLAEWNGKRYKFGSSTTLHEGQIRETSSNLSLSALAFRA